MLISVQLVKEMLRIRTSAFGGVRVPDLEVDGVHRTFAKEIGVWQLVGGGGVVGP